MVATESRIRYNNKLGGDWEWFSRTRRLPFSFFLHCFSRDCWYRYFWRCLLLYYIGKILMQLVEFKFSKQPKDPWLLFFWAGSFLFSYLLLAYLKPLSFSIIMSSVKVINISAFSFLTNCRFKYYQKQFFLLSFLFTRYTFCFYTLVWQHSNLYTLHF